MKKNLFLVILVGMFVGLSFLLTVTSQEPGESPLPPSSWSHRDVGDVKLSGSAQWSNSICQVSGSGGDLFGTADAFHFMHQPWSGDGVLIARILNIASRDGGGKAGLMIRSGVEPGAVNMLLALTRFNRITFQRRLDSADQSERDSYIVVPLPGEPQQTAKPGRVRVWLDGTNGSVGKISAPHWLKIVRRGNDFSSFCSADGTNWQWLATERIPMPSEVHVGLTVTSFKERALCSARFDHVSIQSLASTTAVAVAGAGQGLLGNFWERAGTNRIQRINPTVNFDWSRQERRLPGINFTNFSASWEGYVEAQYTEPYAFQLVHDDCARLWVDGQLLTEDCQQTGLGQAKAVVSLEAGRKYPIRVQYSQEKGQAAVKLMWSSPSTPKQVIPRSQLYAPDDPAVLAAPNIATNRGATDLSRGLEALQATDQSAALPPPWLSRALGSMTNAHTAEAVGGRILARGGGGFSGRAIDEGRFVYEPWQGDVEIVAQITSTGTRNPSDRVGLMIRENLKEESPTAFLEIDPKNRTRLFFRKRVERGQFLGPYGRGRAFLKLVRRGDTFTAYSSTNGVRWAWLNSFAVPMSSQVFVGLVAGSQESDQPFEAWFDNVQVSVPSSEGGLLGSGDGLSAVYKDEITGTQVERVDPEVNFVWGHRSPATDIGHANFTVSWEGLVEAQYSEVYRIHLVNDQRVRLWLNGKRLFNGAGATTKERRAKVRMDAGRRYALRIEYEHHKGLPEVRLLWSSPSTPKQVIPQSQLYSRGSEAYAEIADKDHDGLLDEWELAHGLNPFDAGDAKMDSDHDDLSNLEEYQARTDPQNEDTDGDGLPDGIEVKEMGTNPLFGDVQSIETMLEVPGASAVAEMGGWVVEGEVINCMRGRGWVEYVLQTAQADMYRLQLEGGTWGTDGRKKEAELLVWLDGEYLGRSVLAGGDEGGFVNQLTPWLKAGNHRLRIFWDNAIWNRTFRLGAIRLQQLKGLDLNNNGIKDWVENRLRLLCGVEVAPQFSAVSPVCIEGRGRYLGMMDISESASPQPGCGDRWYADVPLSPTNATRVICSFQNGGLWTTNRITWRPTNLLQASNLVLRAGDALLLTAQPAGAQQGQMQIAIAGVTNYAAPVGSRVMHQFAAAGTFSVTGTYVSPTGQIKSRTVEIEVVTASLGSSPATWVGKWRPWDPPVPAGLVLETDPRLKFKAAVDDATGAPVQVMTTDERIKRYALARTGATNGPVVASVAVDGFRLYSARETGVQAVAIYPDGSELVEMGMVLSPVIPGVRIRIQTRVGGVMFDDGTLVKNLTAADFNELGQATVRFIRAPTFKTSICHRVDVFEGSVPIGSYP